MIGSIPVALLVLLLLVVNSTAVALGASPLNVYQSCVMPDGVSGQCRSQYRVTASPADAQAALELPIDMRLPCTDANRSCAENVDVAEVPVKAPGVSSCSVTLMPWSPFPCTYSTQAYTGVEGQNKTSWCYSQSTKPQERGYEHARDLVTDGYTNRFHGWLPDMPCGATTTSTISSSSGGASSKDGGGGDARAAEGPGYGRHFDKVLLTLNFRVAAGRQFDRTYWFQIGRAVAAVGTLTEPTRWLGTDKWWSTTVDVTHLQAYLAPGLPTRMSLANLLSNTYNVPLWAEATLQFDWTPEQQPASSTPPQSLEAAAVGTAAVPQDAEPPTLQKAPAPPTAPPTTAAPTPAQEPASATAPAPLKAAAAAAAAAHVPDEVVPLVLSEDDAESMTVLAGQGDSPAAWPRATFQLPAALSAPGNIYRAQLLVTPKADACEEFWAMNPSGAGTNNTCGGLSTGEPYREVRVYVNGQLAGFTPIYYTMYTGGVDPRLWSAIVASYTYNLPTYTFDLSPWLPQLNSQPTPSPSKQAQPPATTGPSLGGSGSASAAAAADEPAASRRLTQDSPAATPPATAAGAANPQVSSVPPTTVSTPSSGARQQQDHQQHQYQQQQLQQRWASAVGAGSQEAGHTITVELAGATGNGWIVGSTLLLWRAVGPDGQPQAVGGQAQVVVESSPGFGAPLASRCEPLQGASNASEVAEAGRCTLAIRDRSLQASSTLQWQSHQWEAVVRYSTATYDNIITYNNSANVTDGALTWYQETHHEATWSVTRRQPAADAGQGKGHTPAPDKQQQQQGPQEVPAAAAGDLSGVLTQSSVKLDWLNSGVVAAGGVFEFSFNSTLLQPTVYAAASLAGGGQAGASGGRHTAAHVVTGAQQHYQRALMLNVYTPASPKCVVPDNATHTVTLRSTLSSGSSCVRRSGTCGFCGARLMSNVLDWEC